MEKFSNKISTPPAVSFFTAGDFLAQNKNVNCKKHRNNTCVFCVLFNILKELEKGTKNGKNRITIIKHRPRNGCVCCVYM